jgi:hypothetical protein
MIANSGFQQGAAAGTRFSRGEMVPAARFGIGSAAPGAAPLEELHQPAVEVTARPREVGCERSHEPYVRDHFKRSTKLYKLAMSYNRGLDRDKDGIACEKA